MVFQAAFQIWLAVRSGRADVSFEHLYTGRNVDLENPQSINGTCANFLPLRSHLDLQKSVKEYLSGTKTIFWDATENGNVGSADIYRACRQKPDEIANTALSLFQPFDSPKAEEADEMRWIIRAKSEVRMPQPYVVVCEVVKTNKGYTLEFAYDNAAFDDKGAYESVC